MRRFAVLLAAFIAALGHVVAAPRPMLRPTHRWFSSSHWAVHASAEREAASEVAERDRRRWPSRRSNLRLNRRTPKSVAAPRSCSNASANARQWPSCFSRPPSHSISTTHRSTMPSNGCPNDTGLPIELTPSTRGAGRKVTVESGPLPVWEAIELFCRKADVHEWDGITPLPNSPVVPTPVPQPNIAFGGIQGQVIINGRVSRMTNAPEPKVVLLDGPSPALPVTTQAPFVCACCLPARRFLGP